MQTHLIRPHRQLQARLHPSLLHRHSHTYAHAHKNLSVHKQYLQAEVFTFWYMLNPQALNINAALPMRIIAASRRDAF
jgi:hypothetical protein